MKILFHHFSPSIPNAFPPIAIVPLKKQKSPTPIRLSKTEIISLLNLLDRLSHSVSNINDFQTLYFKKYGTSFTKKLECKVSGKNAYLDWTAVESEIRKRANQIEIKTNQVKTNDKQQTPFLVTSKNGIKNLKQMGVIQDELKIEMKMNDEKVMNQGILFLINNCEKVKRN